MSQDELKIIFIRHLLEGEGFCRVNTEWNSRVLQMIRDIANAKKCEYTIYKVKRGPIREFDFIKCTYDDNYHSQKLKEGFEYLAER